MSDLETTAKQAAIDASNVQAVGNLVSTTDDQEPGVITFRFDSKLKGYVGWFWDVSLFKENEKVTVSEVNLVAGENSVLAPKWIPWSERLADYKALQAALELQAAEEAAAELEKQNAETDSEAQTTEDDDFEELEEIEEDSLPTAAVPETNATEQDADDASGNEPGFFRLFRRNKKRK